MLAQDSYWKMLFMVILQISGNWWYSDKVYVQARSVLLVLFHKMSLLTVTTDIMITECVFFVCRKLSVVSEEDQNQESKKSKETEHSEQKIPPWRQEYLEKKKDRQVCACSCFSQIYMYGMHTCTQFFFPSNSFSWVRHSQTVGGSCSFLGISFGIDMPNKISNRQ